MKSFDKLERAMAETSEIPKSLNISPELARIVDELVHAADVIESETRQKYRDHKQGKNQ